MGLLGLILRIFMLQDSSSDDFLGNRLSLGVDLRSTLQKILPLLPQVFLNFKRVFGDCTFLRVEFPLD